MDLIDTFTEWVEIFPQWVQALMGLVVAAKGITVLTPSKSDDAYLDKALKFLNVIALNVGKDKNADA